MTIDHLTRDGAERLASAITAHWLRRGYRIKTALVARPAPCDSKHWRHDIRSDLVNGLPAPAAELARAA